MAACNASLESEIDFQQQVENYRRSFVQNMNNDMRDNSVYGSFNTYKVKKDKYAAIQDVVIENHSFAWSLQRIIIDNSWLLLWVLVLIALIYKRNNIRLYH